MKMLMQPQKEKAIWMLILGGLLMAMVQKPAFALAPDMDLMRIKGYSPEVIHTVEVQRNRQEWRVPMTPRHSPLERILYNIYYNDWTGSMDEFGSYVIRNRM